MAGAGRGSGELAGLAEMTDWPGIANHIICTRSSPDGGSHHGPVSNRDLNAVTHAESWLDSSLSSLGPIPL